MFYYPFNYNFRDLYNLELEILNAGISISNINFDGTNLIICSSTELTNTQLSNITTILQNYQDNYNEYKTDTKLISVQNSSSTPLSSNSVFNGVYEDISDYSTLTVSCLSDKNSASNGLQICFSADGITDHYIKTYTIYSNDIFIDTITIPFTYFKIKYTNGPYSQGSFVLQSSAHLYKSKNGLDTTQKNEVVIKEEILDDGQVPTNGFFRSEGFSMTCGALSTSSTTFSFPYPIAPTVIKFYVRDTNVGDSFNTYIAEKTTIGVLTTSHSSGTNVLSVSDTVIKHIKVGFICTVSNGATENALGEVISVNQTNNTITVEQNLSTSFPANSLVKMTINNIKNYSLYASGLNIIGDSRIGSSYLPPNTPIKIYYTNNGLVSKTFYWNVEYMY